MPFFEDFRQKHQNPITNCENRSVAKTAGKPQAGEKKSTTRRVDGDHLIYRLFMEVIEMPGQISEPVIDLMLERMSIWFKPEVYQQMPVLLPWVVRDPKCRKPVDQWASPDSKGFLRDDNSLVKGIPRSLKILGPKGSPLNGTKLGNSFVACHIWQKIDDESLATRDPLLNSFVPNLVWLPTQIAKLSDHDGGTVQNALKRMSIRLYRDLDLEPSISLVASEVWAKLPDPTGKCGVNLDQIHYFDNPPKFLSTREAILNTIADFVSAVASGKDLPPKGRISTRYFEGLPKIDKGVVASLASQLSKHSNAATKGT